MTRRIVLDLAEDTTADRCGTCPQIGEPRGHWCSIWGAMTIGRRRSPECIAAEARAERMIEIDPEDAALDEASLSCPVDPHRDAMLNAAWDRITEALREHGRKAKR